jgi:hypothetical protein
MYRPDDDVASCSGRSSPPPSPIIIPAVQQDARKRKTYQWKGNAPQSSYAPQNLQEREVLLSSDNLLAREELLDEHLMVTEFLVVV